MKKEEITEFLSVAGLVEVSPQVKKIWVTPRIESINKKGINSSPTSPGHEGGVGPGGTGYHS